MIFGRWEVVAKKEARDKQALMTQSDFPSNTLSGRSFPVNVEVDGCDLDIGEGSVLVEKYCASSVVGNVETVREKLVVNIFNCLLQGDDVPFSLQFASR